tara:strand:- start:286 stop:867 length:582 start_codon:yes stop_codon:yes gene_type:complete
MDLKQYKEMIKNQILDDVRKQIAKEHKIATGTYTTKHIAQYEDVAKHIQPKKKTTKKTKKKILPPPLNEDDNELEEQGGKVHFLKHMKGFGKSVAKFGKKAGKAISNEVIKQGSQQLGKMALEGAKDFMTYAPVVAEEGAPLLLAAGMKKPKRKRLLSDKEKRRHILVRKIMNEHGCSLPEASKYIKQHNLTY